jgi:hypothetical protein
MAAWLAPHAQQLRLYLAGPAQRLFKAEAQTHNLEACLAKAQLLISGTGWASDLEHEARRLAKQRGLPSVAVLDHWLNYRERFQRNGEEVLPDQLWVADAEAEALARRTFPGLPVLRLNNHWLEELCQTVSKHRREPVQRPARRLLYLLEPVRVNWPHPSKEPGELQGLNYWLSQLPLLIEQGWVVPQDQLEALSLRPHPSEAPGKYSDWIRTAAEHWPVELDQAGRLAESLAWTDAAFGCETQALVAAMACELPAFSTVPPWAPPCRLPQASLHHLHQLEGA